MPINPKEFIKSIKDRVASPKQVVNAYIGQAKSAMEVKKQRDLSKDNLKKNIGEFPYGSKNQATIHKNINKLVDKADFKGAKQYTESQMLASGNVKAREDVLNKKVRLREQPSKNYKTVPFYGQIKK